jgi:hypothetical protein
MYRLESKNSNKKSRLSLWKKRKEWIKGIFVERNEKGGVMKFFMEKAMRIEVRSFFCGKK